MREAASGDLAKTPGKQGKTRQRRTGPFKDLGEGASSQARRQAAAILEVLAGVRTPTQAAEAIGVSLPRYYVLETQAVQGILLTCEPKRMGRQKTAESALATLRRECEQLRRECARQQALVRAAQRSMGLAPPAPPKSEKTGPKRRKRRPTARALRAVARLKTEEALPSEPSAVSAAMQSRTFRVSPPGRVGRRGLITEEVMRGRYPDGLKELLETREVPAEDKRRLQAILDTMYGARVLQTCEDLDIGETRFRQLRDRALDGALEGIRSRPSGRPSRRMLADAERIRELEQELAETRLELQQALVRAEVALILPQRSDEETVKKGRTSNVNLRKRKPR